MEDQPPWIQYLHFIRKVNNLDYIITFMRMAWSIAENILAFQLEMRYLLRAVLPTTLF